MEAMAIRGSAVVTADFSSSPVILSGREKLLFPIYTRGLCTIALTHQFDHVRSCTGQIYIFY
jgi:hypothetical protein